MSWVEYPADHPFPIQNLPYGVFKNAQGERHACIAIGDFVLDLFVLASKDSFFASDVNDALKQPTLNAFMALSHERWAHCRSVVQKLLAKTEAKLRDDKELRAEALIAQTDVEMVLPARVGDYTGFYASKEHASNMGKMFRPGLPPLMENWLHIPVGYHGRASSVVVSGTPIHRPHGQHRPDPEKPPVFGPCKAMDFELEMGFYVGGSKELGEPVTMANARNHIFGLALFNDWSARDLQKWEYVPLGPFLGKSFGSTVSPWIVPLAALEPFAVSAPPHDPECLPYLKETKPGNFDINLSVAITTKEKESITLANTNYKFMYWSGFQMLVHHSCNGCNMQAGDLFGSGTISGPEEGMFGSMIEIAWQGTKPVKLPSGAERKMIADGDTVDMNGFCKGDGYVIGFGPCSGQILPAKDIKF